MKIRIKSTDHDLKLAFPTKLLCGKMVARIGEKLGRRYAAEAMAQIPPGAMEALCAEIRRLKDIRGSMTLVEVTSSSGEEITVIL